MQNFAFFKIKTLTPCMYSIAGMVDVIFADVAQPDQARIVSINAHHFLKNQGHFVISIKVMDVSVCVGGGGAGF